MDVCRFKLLRPSPSLRRRRRRCCCCGSDIFHGWLAALGRWARTSSQSEWESGRLAGRTTDGHIRPTDGRTDTRRAGQSHCARTGAVKSRRFSAFSSALRYSCPVRYWTARQRPQYDPPSSSANASSSSISRTRSVQLYQELFRVEIQRTVQ